MYRLVISLLLSVPIVAATAAIDRPPADEIERSAAAFELVPGVIVGDGTVYAMNPGGAVDALAADSGAVLWSSAAAAKPLALYGGLLAAQPEIAERAGVLDVVLLDRLSGSPRDTVEVELPSHVWGQVDDRLGSVFNARGGIRGGELYVAWEHRGRPARGLAPRPGEATETRTVGAYRLDVTTGGAEAADPEVLAEPSFTLPAAVQRMVDSGSLNRRPLRAGAVIAGTASALRDGQTLTALKRWDAESGEALPDVDLFTGSHVVQLPSADGRHLLIGQRVAAGEREEYGWTIFALETGERLGQVRDHFSHSRFFVNGSTLVHVAPPYGRDAGGEWIEQPRRLRGVALETGSEIWARPLRDPTYQGLYPP